MLFAGLITTLPSIPGAMATKTLHLHLPDREQGWGHTLG